MIRKSRGFASERLPLATVWLALCWLVAVSCDAPDTRWEAPEETLAQTIGDKNVTAEQLFAMADAAKGPSYLEAERQLLDMGPHALPTLKGHSNDTDLVTRHMAQCLAGWIEEKPKEYDDALAYLSGLPERFRRTPLTAPPPTGVANYLEREYGGGVADLLALRLVKATDWPQWQVLGVVFYLEVQKAPTTIGPLIRFAVETSNDKWRDAASDAIRAAEDPKLPQKLEAERQRAKESGKAFPVALDGL